MSLKGLVELEEQIESGSYKTQETHTSNITPEYTTGYNPMEEMKQMKSSGVITEDIIKSSKLPKEILESFIEKPSVVNEELMYKTMGGSSVDVFHNKDGWADRVREINGKVESKDKRQVVESSSPYTETAPEVLRSYSQNNTSGNSTESILLQILDRLHKIEEKIDEIDVFGSNRSELKVFQITEGGDFMFLDTDGNVYKAEMEYKGKKKK